MPESVTRNYPTSTTVVWDGPRDVVVTLSGGGNGQNGSRGTRYVYSRIGGTGEDPVFACRGIPIISESDARRGRTDGEVSTILINNAVVLTAPAAQTITRNLQIRSGDFVQFILGAGGQGGGFFRTRSSDRRCQSARAASQGAGGVDGSASITFERGLNFAIGDTLVDGAAIGDIEIVGAAIGDNIIS